MSNTASNESMSIELPARLRVLIERHAEVSGRTLEEELVHGILMWFDPEYQKTAMKRLLDEMNERFDMHGS